MKYALLAAALVFTVHYASAAWYYTAAIWNDGKDEPHEQH